MTKLGTLILALAVVACGKGNDKPSKDDKAGGGGGGASTGTPDVAAVNALVPAALKDKIVFEERGLVVERGKKGTTYTLAVPKGWTQQSKMFANLKADDKGGFFSDMKIASDCDGACEPKAWEPIADKNFFAERAKGKVIKDEKSAGKRLMIADVDSNGVKTRDVVFAWWAEGAKSYHACVVKLDEAVKDASPAFEKACQAVKVDGED
jgi:hypothetical protein